MQSHQHDIFRLYKRLLAHFPAGTLGEFIALTAGALLVAFLESFFLAGVGGLATLSPSSNQLGGWSSLLSLVAVNISEGQFLVIYIGLLVFCLWAKNILQTFFLWCTCRLTFGLEFKIGKQLLCGYIDMPYSESAVRNSSDMFLTHEWRYYTSSFCNSIMSLIADILLVLMLFITLAIMTPSVTVALTSCFGILGIAIYKLSKKKLDKHSADFRSTQLAISRIATAGLHGLKDVKITSSRGMVLCNYQIYSDPYRVHRTMLNVIPKLSTNSLESLGFTGVAFASWILVYSGSGTKESAIASVVMLCIGAWRILPAINRIVTQFSGLRATLPYVSALLEALEESPEPLPEEKKRPMEFSLEVKEIVFSYPGAALPTLSGVNFSLTKGESLGIVGHSGAGKSTLVDILCGLLKPSSGDIRIDGHSRTGLDIKIGYVSQAPYVFDGTLAENIAFNFNSLEIDYELVKEVCGLASIDFLDDLPLGLDSEIGERGARLSGGQIQRVAIARALYRKPDLLILDEATSALDTKTEKEIQATIENLRGRISMVIVAHRLTTIERCDKILWLDHGKVRQYGIAGEILPLVHASHNATAAHFRE
jgi:ABC-type multidrug transport system fused ATPase/permease subunit